MAHDQMQPAHRRDDVRRDRPWPAAATSCRSIRPTIRMRSRSRRWRPSARRTSCATARCTPMSAVRRDLLVRFPRPSRAVESLGSFVVVRVNPASPLAKDEASACAPTGPSSATIGGKAGELILHPYPVTPFHGDYLHHVDLAEAAKARLLGAPLTQPAPSSVSLKVRAVGALAKKPRSRRMAAPANPTGMSRSIEVSAARPRGLGERRDQRLAWSALGQDRLVSRLSAARATQLSIAARRRRIESDVERLQAGDYRRRRRAHQSGARPRRRARRTAAARRRRLHRQAGILQRRVLGRHREHRV